MATLTLSACGGAKVGEDSGSSGGGECGEFNIAINPWVGYEANAAVIAEVAEQELGCNVNKKDLKEEVAWQGFGTGEVDAIVENWGHEDLKQKYIKEQKTAVEAGSTGVKGEIGWFVPKWMTEKYPGITNWKNLNKYANLFKTSESGGKGQLLDGDPSFVTNDEALVKNLNLNYKVVYAGSENALNEAFTKADEQRTPVLGYFYTPQWLQTQVDLVRVKLPQYKPGCDADPEKIACDYPTYDLDKIVSKQFADENGPAFKLVKNFQWTNEDQNQVATMIAKDKMSPEQAAKKWVQDNKDKVNSWIGKD
ncbi:MAG: glycine/betaine ABC transporter substrate-binding protein [Pseudonocardiaceae bacterium]|nr:glycine/betaine ABC transporter substrate-binding protein [Pseudonocardiaceae bacterium]